MKNRKRNKIDEPDKIFPSLTPKHDDQEIIISLDAIDAMIDDPSTSPTFRGRFINFRSKFQPGDCLYEFCTSQESWDSLMGLAGFIIKRDGVTIASLTMRMN